MAQMFWNREHWKEVILESVPGAEIASDSENEPTEYITVADISNVSAI